MNRTGDPESYVDMSEVARVDDDFEWPVDIRDLDWPFIGSHCWILGHDVITETKGGTPVDEFERTFNVIHDFLGSHLKTSTVRAYRYDIEYKSVYGFEDGPRTWCVEVADAGRGDYAVWIDWWRDNRTRR